MTECRKAERRDIPQILSIVEDARANFKRQGIPQWQNGYPNEQTIEQDIARGWSFVVCEDGEICAIAAIVLEPDPNYAQIQGKWLCAGKYAAIHRVAVKEGSKKRGYASRIVRCAEDLARKNSCVSLRCDTHEVNRPMRGMLEKNGFCYCGIVHIQDDGNAPRVAYERPLEPLSETGKSQAD